MPRVKIDYVVSFSNEDPENQVSNLLSWEVSKKRWLCRAGEPTCSVVLQLARAAKISSLQIGVHHAALVEVLVGRSETPNEPYQVLVPRSVFLSPRESRGADEARVRSFSGAALGPAAAQRWDRLRLVCSQPYNKHCSYGISFIHVFELEGEAPPPAPAPAPALPPRMFSLDTFSSDEEEFSPGELFAKHRQSGGDTGAQIRHATSQALENNSEAAAATKLVKTTLSKHKPPASRPSPRPAAPSNPRDAQRDKDDLLYNKDDDQPHAKIDHIVQRHKDAAKTPNLKERVKEIEKDKTPHSKKESSSGKHSENKRDKVERKKEQDNGDRSQTNKDGASSSKNKNESRKRPHSERIEAEDECGAGGAGGAAPLAGAVLVFSGYANPRRARLRQLAAALGARTRPAWDAECTHLICAFSSTPKLAAVRALAGGGAVPAPRADWLEECARRARRLPWRWFAAEPARRLSPPPSEPRSPRSPRARSECDTDDEIEAVLRRNKKARASPSPPPPPAAPRSPPAPTDDGDEVEFVKDERMQGSVTLEDSDSCDTDAEGPGAGGAGRGAGGALPALLAGRRLAAGATGPLDARLLARYCRAYGGRLLEPEEVEQVGDDCLVLCGRRRGGGRAARGGGTRVRADWLWACHAAARLLPVQDYLL